MEDEAGVGAGLAYGIGVPHIDRERARRRVPEVPLVAPRLDRATTSAPRARSARTTAEPMNPAAPVTTTRSPLAMEI